jgi:hypothetical protein
MKEETGGNMGKMRVRGWGLCLGIALVGCSSAKDDASGSATEWREAANQVNDATCEMTYACYSAKTLDALRMMEPQLGQSVDECKQNFRAANSKATQACPSGQTFQKANAEQCVSELEGLECQKFLGSPPAACGQICASGSQLVPACSEPAELPAAIDLPDGGALPMFQPARGHISGGETDTFTIPLDCKPGYGFAMSAKPISADLDIALTFDIAGLHGTDDDGGPGSGESSTLVTGSKVALPNELVVNVSAVAGTTGEYELVITSDP